MSYFLGGRKVRCPSLSYRFLPSVGSALTPRLCSQNPNGCTPRMTYYTSLSYTNYSMVTEM